MSVRAIRGAIQSEENSVESIGAATKELLLAIIEENKSWPASVPQIQLS